LDILLVTAFLETRLLVCVTAPSRAVHHPEVSGRGILGEGCYDPKPPAETTKDLRWSVCCNESACLSGGPLLRAFLRWCGRCIPAARRLRLQLYRAIPRKSLSGNHFGSTEGHVIAELRGPGYDSGSGLALLLRNRDKRYLLYLMACLLSGEVVLPRAYDTDVYLTGLGMLLTTVCLFGLISRSGAPGSFAVLAMCLLGLWGRSPWHRVANAEGSSTWRSGSPWARDRFLCQGQRREDDRLLPLQTQAMRT
jgi:hypothetical protein